MQEFGPSVEVRSKPDMVKTSTFSHSTFDYLDPSIEDGIEYRGRDAVRLKAFNRLSGRYGIVETIAADKGYRVESSRIVWMDQQTFYLEVTFTPD